MKPDELNSILNLIYTAMGILTVLGGVVVWLLSQRFVSKKSFGSVLKGKEEETRALELRIIKLEEAQNLAKGPMENVQKGIDELKEQITTLSRTVIEMDKKLAILDQAEKDRRMRGGRGSGR